MVFTLLIPVLFGFSIYLSKNSCLTAFGIAALTKVLSVPSEFFLAPLRGLEGLPVKYKGLQSSLTL